MDTDADDGDYHLSRVLLIKPCVGCTEGVARAKGFTVALVPGEKKHSAIRFIIVEESL